jgi:hypothetical protein
MLARIADTAKALHFCADHASLQPAVIGQPDVSASGRHVHSRPVFEGQVTRDVHQELESDDAPTGSDTHRWSATPTQ